MSEPVTIDIPHKLGRAAARARLEHGMGQIAHMIPGGSVTSHHWEGDTLTFTVETLGQRILAKLEVMDTVVHAVVDLPPLAALFAGKVRSELLGIGTKLLT